MNKPKIWVPGDWNAFFGFGTNIVTLDVLRFLQGAACGFIWGGGLTWVIAVAPRERRGEMLGSVIGAAIFGTILGPVLGTLAAVALTRAGRFGGRTLFTGMVYAPLVMPEVITGLSLLLMFVAVGAGRGFWSVTIAHTTLTMCFVAVVVQSLSAQSFSHVGSVNVVGLLWAYA